MSDFPVLFSLGGNRHEVILISSSTSLESLSSQIVQAATDSPNAAEFMSKFKSKDSKGFKVGSIKVKWSTESRDSRIWPTSTVLTERNSEAVLKIVQIRGVGRDVLEVAAE
jgi:hypothetical protein